MFTVVNLPYVLALIAVIIVYRGKFQAGCPAEDRYVDRRTDRWPCGQQGPNWRFVKVGAMETIEANFFLKKRTLE